MSVWSHSLRFARVYVQLMSKLQAGLASMWETRICHTGYNQFKSIVAEFYIYQEWKEKCFHHIQIVNIIFADVCVRE